MTLHSDEHIQQLIARAQAGDSSAVSDLYERYVDRIYRYIAYRVPDSDAEDLTADVFVSMVTDLPNFTYTGAPFEAWLYRIARARVADFHRKHKPNTEEMDEELSDRALLPEERVVQQQEFASVQGALQALNEDEQTLLILRFVERRSHKEVAAVMGKSVAAVRTMQHRALHKLAQHLDAAGKERHYLRGLRSAKPDEESDT